jgi:Glycosyl hydrolases family 38 N-terminal domain/Glycosyl hydrolases family 38 C-terminal beta sandwich domain/Glycosyl hydrolases family 38 C-terminal domain
MRFYSLLLLLVISLPLSGQINHTLTDEGIKNDEVTDIVVVFKMHVDIGYTNWAEAVLHNYSNEMLEETLKSIDETSPLTKSEQFVWTIPAWPLNYMLEHSSPLNKGRLEKAIVDERIVAHALPFTYETEASDLENLVRGLNYASTINRKYGLPLPRDAKMTDVPSHSRVMPTLLKNAGIDFLHIGCNPGSASPDIPTLFWWQGPDGSKVLTFYWAEYYGSGILPPENWKHKTWLALIHTHENTGAPSPEDVAELLKTAKMQIPNARITIGHMADFYDLLMKENPSLPVITGDMPDTWIHGYMSMPRETKISKFLQKETYNTEAFNTLLNTWLGIENDISSNIDKAVENMILFDEHTFGVALSHGDQHKWSYNDDFKINKSLGYYDFAEGSWNEKSSRIRTAERNIVPVMKDQLKNLAASVAVDGKRIVVYNPLPWSRGGRVDFFEGIYRKDFVIHAIKDVVTGKILPVYEDYNHISFDAEAVPAMGYKTYIPILEPVSTISALSVDNKTHTLENKYFKLIIDTISGSLSSVYNKQTGHELVNIKSEFGFAEYLFQQYGQEDLDSYNNSYVKLGAESWANPEMGRPFVPEEKSKIYRGKCNKIVFKDMGNAVRATVLGKLNDFDSQRYLVTYTLYENQPYIEINWGIDGKRPNSNPEAGWLSFPFAVKDPEYRLLRTGGIVDPNKELVDRTNHDYYFLNTSMAMFESSGSGVALNCPDSPGISIDIPGLYTFSGKKKLTTGSIFANLYNTQWGTNFTEWIEGSFSSTFYIWDFMNYDPEESLLTPGEETRVPLQGAYFEGKKGSLPLTNTGISIDRKGVLVTAYGKNRDGDDSILRLWELAGKSGQCKVTLPGGCNFQTAYPCNLRGEIISKNGIEISNNAFKFFLGANKPASFILI